MDIARIKNEAAGHLATLGLPDLESHGADMLDQGAALTMMHNALREIPYAKTVEELRGAAGGLNTLLAGSGQQGQEVVAAATETAALSEGLPALQAAAVEQIAAARRAIWALGSAMIETQDGAIQTRGLLERYLETIGAEE